EGKGRGYLYLSTHPLPKKILGAETMSSVIPADVWEELPGMLLVTDSSCNCGLQQGDYIYSVEGEVIGPNQEVIDMLVATSPNDKLRFQVVREKQLITLEVPIQRLNRSDI